jgi:hypothetical protein
MKTFANIQASLLQKVALFSAQLGHTPINFDAVHDVNSLSDLSYVGLASLSVQETDVGEAVSAIIVVVTRDDTNNMRLSDSIAEIYEQCKKEVTWDLVNADTGDTCGFMVMVEGTAVLPVTQPSETMVSQAIQFNALCVQGLTQS